MQESDLLFDGIKISHEIIEIILNEGAEILYDTYISELSRPFSVNITSESIFACLEFYHLRHEVLKDDIWPELSEPQPCAIDTWARNAIPTKKIYKLPPPAPVSIAADAKSINSHKSSRSTRSALGLRHKVLKAALQGVQKSITEAPQPFPMVIPKIVLTEKEEELRYIKEHEAKRKAEEDERRRKYKEEVDEKERRIKKEAAEMKNKEFTYDNGGNIIFVSHLKYDKIPKVLSEVEVKQVEGKSEGITVLPVSKTKKAIEEVNRLRTAPVREQEWVKNITSVGPSVFENIKLSAGVTLTEGNRVKYPTTMHTSSQKTFSRKDYTNLATKYLEIPGLSIDQKNSNYSSHDSFKKASAMSSKRNLMEDIPDYEWAVGENEESEEIKVQTLPEKHQGKITRYGMGYQYTEESALNKFNAQILNNKNWGVNPGMKKPVLPERVPKRPNSKDLREIFGDISKKPKDKPFITSKELWDIQGSKMKKPRDRPFVEKVEKKKKMPPPPYGFTMINAIPEYEDLLKSNLKP